MCFEPFFSVGRSFRACEAPFGLVLLDRHRGRLSLHQRFSGVLRTEGVPADPDLAHQSGCSGSDTEGILSGRQL